MVKTLRLAAVISALLLSLVSCDALFNGVFPPAVGQVTARADLSASIAAAAASSFSLSTVSAGGNEYVILFTSLGFDSSRPHLLIMDSRLKVLSSYTLGELGTVAPGGTFSGGAAMTDASDQVLIGNVFFTVLPSGLLAPAGNPTGVGLFGPAITILPMDSTFHEANYRVSLPSLTWTEYSSGWNAPFTYSCILGGPTQSLRILTIFEDRDSASTPDVFVFQDDNSQQTSFAKVPKADIYNDLTAALQRIDHQEVEPRLGVHLDFPRGDCRLRQHGRRAGPIHTGRAGHREHLVAEMGQPHEGGGGDIRHVLCRVGSCHSRADAIRAVVVER